MDKELELLIGCMLQELGGEFQISAKAQEEFMTSVTDKEVLFKQDPKTKVITVKLEDYDKVIEELAKKLKG